VSCDRMHHTVVVSRHRSPVPATRESLTSWKHACRPDAAHWNSWNDAFVTSRSAL
jgi:hypothetical protein